MTRRSILLAAFAGLHTSPVQWVSKNLENGKETCRWDLPDAPVSMGSLLKPFLALGYKATHNFYPVTYCSGSSSGCWYAKGHGQQRFVDALANSCNTYFMQVAEMLNRAALDTVCLTYGLQLPGRSLLPSDLIGLRGGWPQSPANVVHAFSTLIARAKDMDVQMILGGMASCARFGTARAVSLDCYAKTGTAPCSHKPKGSGDGFAVVVYPTERPRRLILLQHHNTTGANAVRNIKPLVSGLG